MSLEHRSQKVIYVGTTGHFLSGKLPDIGIFRLKLKKLLGLGEKVVADKNYRGDTRTYTPIDSKHDAHREGMNRARARHETTNGRLCIFGCFRQVFRHPVEKHHIFFEAALRMTQIGIENGRCPWQVQNYFDPAFCLDDYAREEGLGHLVE